LPKARDSLNLSGQCPIHAEPIHYIEEPGEDGEVTRSSKSGRYFDKPWEIRAGLTTKIDRETCVITERDKRNYEAKMRELRGEGQQLKIASLQGEPLGKLDEFDVALDSATFEGKRILLCFWDMSQRPSRWCIGQLAKRKEELIQKDIVTVGIHASQVDQERLNDWLSENEIDFPVGMAKSAPDQLLQSWGVQARPWLILTDREHIVVAEGFGLNELDVKIERNSHDL
jgi:hypothetical protein